MSGGLLGRRRAVGEEEYDNATNNMKLQMGVFKLDVQYVRLEIVAIQLHCKVTDQSKISVQRTR